MFPVPSLNTPEFSLSTLVIVVIRQGTELPSLNPSTIQIVWQVLFVFLCMCMFQERTRVAKYKSGTVSGVLSLEYSHPNGTKNFHCFGTQSVRLFTPGTTT